ncbi:MAG: SURF1 family protein [Actinomycetota bacterium]|nr:SURF1 family protein [Actinomycetota bacterium]
MLKPRWLGLLGLLLVVLTAFTVLGLWQLSVARDDGRRAAVEGAQSQPAPLAQVLTPQQAFPAAAFGRPVEAVGRYDASGQVLVAGRRLDGAPGWWVVTPLVVSDSRARLAVLRGFVRDASKPRGPAPTSTGEVSVVGTVAPGESPASTGSRGDLPAGQLGSLDLGRLVNMWDAPTYNAFVFAVSETPDATGAGAAGSSATGGIERVPPPPVATGLSLRNAAYALQWWVFAVFAAWMWWKMVREDHRRDRFLQGLPPSAHADTAHTDAATSATGTEPADRAMQTDRTAGAATT